MLYYLELEVEKGCENMTELELQKIYQRAGNFFLKDINFSMEKGSVTALIGRSGAGKSTLIRLIAQAEIPEVGKILYEGREMYEDEKNIRSRLSVVYDKPNFNMELKAGRLAEKIKKIEPDFSMDMFQKYMEIAQLDRSMKIKQYSTGMQKKYMLILALCRQPELLLMDEPTSAVDPVSREEMLQMIRDYRSRQNVTILFSTHNYEDIEAIADHVMLLRKGELIYHQSKDEVAKEFADKEQILKELGE